MQANTGGCTKQACGFKDNYSEIKKAGFTVFGLSFDKPKSQKNWKTKYELPYHLLTDTTGEVRRTAPTLALESTSYCCYLQVDIPRLAYNANWWTIKHCNTSCR